MRFLHLNKIQNIQHSFEMELFVSRPEVKIFKSNISKSYLYKIIKKQKQKKKVLFNYSNFRAISNGFVPIHMYKINRNFEF